MKKLYVLESLINDDWLPIAFWDGSIQEALQMVEWSATDPRCEYERRVRRVKSTAEAHAISQFPHVPNTHLAHDPDIEWVVSGPPLPPEDEVVIFNQAMKWHDKYCLACDERNELAKLLLGEPLYNEATKAGLSFPKAIAIKQEVERRANEQLQEKLAPTFWGSASPFLVVMGMLVLLFLGIILGV